MLSITAFLLTAAASVSAAVIQQRAAPLTCTDYTGMIPAGQTAVATAYCRQQLALVPVYTTNTNTKTKVKTVTSATTSIYTSVVTPNPVTVTSTTYTTTRVTTTPGITTLQVTLTGTAYVDEEGDTISAAAPSQPVNQKRDTAHVLEKRALPLPTFWKTLSRPQVLAACNCLGLAAQTYTRQATQTVAATSVINKVHTGTIVQTLPTVTNTIPLVAVLSQTVQAPAPVSTVFSTVYADIQSCPPSTTSTFICPDSTGTDDGSLASTGQLACPSIGVDNYSGECAYWLDDGSPAASTFSYEDPDTGDISTRPATYGDATTDDCPSWSDYTCAPNALNQRDFIFELVERAHKKKKIPKGLKRGGQFVPYSRAVANGAI